MSDEAVAEKGRVEATEQKLWPIFACGTALMVLGLYFVFFVEEDLKVEPAPASAVSEVEEIELESTEEGAVTLTWGRGPRSYRMALTQAAVRDEGERLTTAIELTVRDEPVDPEEGEAFAYERHFEDVGVSLRGDTKRYGKEVTNEVVRLIEATVLRRAYDASGALLESRVVSSESAQLRPTLDLLSDTMKVVFGSIPLEAVNPGESWSVRIPSRVSRNSVVEVEGGLELASELRSATEGRALIAQKLTGKTLGTWDDGDERRGHLEVRSSGSGQTLWDRKRGAPIRVEFAIDRETSTPDGTTVSKAEILFSVERID